MGELGRAPSQQGSPFWDFLKKPSVMVLYRLKRRPMGRAVHLSLSLAVWTESSQRLLISQSFMNSFRAMLWSVVVKTAYGGLKLMVEWLKSLKGRLVLGSCCLHFKCAVELMTGCCCLGQRVSIHGINWSVSRAIELFFSWTRQCLCFNFCFAFSCLLNQGLSM